MPSVFDGEDEARLYRMVERILRQLPRDNYTQGRGRVAETDVVVRRLATTTAGAAPAAVVDGAPVGGDLTGTLPNPTVGGLQGNAVGTAAPTDGQVLAWSTANSQWEPDDASTSVELLVACSDESTAIDATGTKLTFRLPYAMTVTDVRASLNSACSTGTFTVDINEGGASILSTKLTIDATEKTSTTAATAAVISDSALADDAEITVDVDNTGDDTATGLKVAIIGTRA